VHPASPILLTKNGPLGDSILATTSMKKEVYRAHLEFESRSREKSSRYLRSFALPDATRYDMSPAILRETFA